MSAGDERHRYERAAAVVGTIVEAKAAELFAELAEVQQAVWADVQRRAGAVVAAATRQATGTARTVVAWSLALAGPLGAGQRSRRPSSTSPTATAQSPASSAAEPESSASSAATAKSPAAAEPESPAGTRL